VCLVALWSTTRADTSTLSVTYFMDGQYDLKWWMVQRKNLPFPAGITEPSLRVSGKCATDDDPLKDYPNHLASTPPTYAVSRATTSSAWVGLVVVVCLFSLTIFCLVFGLLQAHSHEMLCWKQQRTLYQPVPMFYHRQGAVGVRLGKQMNTTAADSETSDEHLYQNSPTHREVA